MDPAPHNEVIAVGIDGSVGSRRALAWALQHACDGDRVVLVHAWRESPAMADTGLTERGDDTPAQSLLHHELARAQLHPRATLLHLGTHCREGSAADALREVGADVVVVGAHGHGLMDRLLGSSSAGLVKRPPCAVVVVP